MGYEAVLWGCIERAQAGEGPGPVLIGEAGRQGQRGRQGLPGWQDADQELALVPTVPHVSSAQRHSLTVWI